MQCASYFYLLWALRETNNTQLFRSRIECVRDTRVLLTNSPGKWRRDYDSNLVEHISEWGVIHIREHADTKALRRVLLLRSRCPNRRMSLPSTPMPGTRLHRPSKHSQTCSVLMSVRSISAGETTTKVFNNTKADIFNTFSRRVSDGEVIFHSPK